MLSLIYGPTQNLLYVVNVIFVRNEWNLIPCKLICFAFHWSTQGKILEIRLSRCLDTKFYTFLNQSAGFQKLSKIVPLRV